MKRALAVSWDFFIRWWLYNGKPRPTKEQLKRQRQQRRYAQRSSGSPDIITTIVVAFFIVVAIRWVWP